MDEKERIRKEYFRKRKSIREIAREFQHARKTVKKALMDPYPPVYKRKTPPPEPVLGPVKPIIDGWLSEDKAEEVAANLLMREPTDLVINVVDATNLERNLYLTLQLKELTLPMILDLNMIDVAREQGIEIDIPDLEQALGVPVIPSVAVSGEGIKELRATIVKILRGNEIENRV